MLTPGNNKLGDAFVGFSISIEASCNPTEVCREVCYGKRGHYRFQNVTDSTVRNFEATKKANFATAMIRKLRKTRAGIVRTHVVGDFYRSFYVLQWLHIARRSPQKTFLIYTRAWRSPKMLPYLRLLAGLPNVHLWLSCDNSSGEPPSDPQFVGKAWLSLNDLDVPPYPVEIVFRDNVKTDKSRLGGYYVCPVERLTKKIELTCSICRYCFSPDRVQKQKDKNAKDAKPKRIPLTLV